jgi:hypothetical protein
MGVKKRAWTDEQLVEAVASSKTYVDVLRKLGLREGSSRHLKRCIAKLGLDTSHFDTAGRAPERRMNIADDRLIEIVQRARDRGTDHPVSELPFAAADTPRP